MILKIPMYVHQANMIGNYYTCGFPSMTSIDGMLHAFERQMNEANLNCTVESWYIAVEKAEMNHGHKSFVPGRVAELSKNGINTSIVDERSGHLDITLFVKIFFDDENFSVADCNKMIRTTKFESITHRMKLAGGTTIIYTKQQDGYRKDRTVECFDDLFYALKTINRNAFMIDDHTGNLSEYSKDNESKLETFSRLLYRKKQNLNEEQLSQYNNLISENKEGYYVPLAIGYYGLDTPTIKKNSRDLLTKHVYVEPILGLGRLRTVGSVLFSIKNNTFSTLKLEWGRLTEEMQNKHTNLYVVLGLQELNNEY